MADGVEEPRRFYQGLFSGELVPGLDPRHESLTDHFLGQSVPHDLDLRILRYPVLHRLRGAHLVSADQHDDLASEFREEGRLFARGVPSADYDELLVTEHREGAVAHRAGGDPLLPICFLSGKTEAFRRGAGGYDEGPGLERLPPFYCHGERRRREVRGFHGLGLDPGAVLHGLLAHPDHQVWASEGIWKPGEILDLGGGGELPSRRYAACHEPFEHEGRELRAGRIDRGGMSRGTRSDYYGVLDPFLGHLCNLSFRVISTVYYTYSAGLDQMT